jgi:transposase
MSALVCGLDVHKDSTYATILNDEGKIVDQTRMSNDRVLSYLVHYRVNRVAMGSSTAIAPLFRRLAGRGFEVMVSHPKKTRYIAEAKIRSDRVDSRAIAELARLDALPLAYVPDTETSRLREKVRRRAFLVRQRAKLKVKIKSVLTYEGIEPPSNHGLFTLEGVQWLHSLGLESVDSYLRIMSTFSREIKLLSRQLLGLAEEDEDVKLLMTIPGIGYYSALLVKSEIGDVNRFPFGERLCSYAGLVPSTRSSGRAVRHGGITKEGSRWLRWVMVQAAQTHVHRFDSTVTRMYSRLAERKSKQVALTAAAHKLLLICYSVLKNKRPYYDQA